jgi:hypothetical protein
MFTLFLLVIVKSLNENRFYSFLPLFISDRYLKIYGKEQLPKFDRFNFLLFIVQILLVTLMLSFLLKTYNYSTEKNYLFIAIIVTSFISVKYFIEKILASIFEIEKFVSRFQFHKISYTNLIPILLFPLLILFIFTDLDKKIIITSTFTLFLILNVIALALTIKKQQKVILRWFFYFILYLCAFEIIPYILVIKIILE